MNTENHTHEKDFNSIDFSINDFLANSNQGIDFDFKPINDGLGFHKPQERKTATHLIPPDAIKVKSQVPLYKTNQVVPPIVTPTASAPHLNIKSNKQVRTQYGASLLLSQLGAFLVDLLVVAFALMLIGKIVVFMSSLYEVRFHLADFSKYKFYYISLFVLSWLSYSTLMSPIQTVGQSLFNLKFKAESRPYQSAFIRSLVVALSLLCLGIPTLFDFQGKLSDSRIKHG